MANPIWRTLRHQNLFIANNVNTSVTLVITKFICTLFNLQIISTYLTLIIKLTNIDFDYVDIELTANKKWREKL